MNNLAVFKALANPERIKIMDVLTDNPRREISVKDMCMLIGLSHSHTSQHLKIMRNAGLLDCRKEAQSVFYFIPSGIKWPVSFVQEGGK